MMAPRRICIGDDTPEEVRDCVLVLVDGDRLRDVLAYDCDAGWVMHVKHDDDGNRIVEGECVRVVKVYGDVKAMLA